MVGIKISIVGARSAAYSLHTVAPVEVELGAYPSGSKQRLLELVIIDPWMMSEEQARKILEDVLALPYHDSVRQYYK